MRASGREWLWRLRMAAMPQGRLSTWAVSLAAACTVLLVYWPLLSSNECFYGSGTDTPSQDHPMRVWLFHELGKGTIAYWNPLILGGVPHPPAVQGTFYPGWWTGLLWEACTDVKLSFVLHLMAAAWGGATLAREHVDRSLAAYWGGVTFALGGYMSAHLWAGHRGVVATFAYAPWMALVVWRAVRGAPVPAYRVALLFGLAVLSAHYQVLFIVGAGIALHTAIAALAMPTHHAWAARLARLFRGAATLGMGTAVGVTTAAVQVLPLVGLMPEIQRPAADIEFASTPSAVPASLLQWLLPHALGTGATEPYLGPRPFWESYCYLGSAGVFLGGVAIAQNKLHRWLPHVAALAFGTLLAMGLHTFALPLWLDAVPFAKAFRAPGRYLGLVALYGSILVAMGIDSCLEGTRGRAPRVAGFLLSALALGCIACGVGFPVTSADWIATTFDLWRGADSSARGVLRAAVATDLLYAGASASLIAFCILYRGGARPRAIALFLATGVLLSDLGGLARGFARTAPRGAFEWSAPIADACRVTTGVSGRAIITPELRPNSALPHGIATLGGYGTFLVRRFTEYVNTAYDAPPDTFTASLSLRAIPPMIRYLGPTVVVSTEPAEQLRNVEGLTKLSEVASDGAMHAYRLPTPFPRAFIVHHGEFVGDRDERLRRLRSKEFRPRRTVLLEEEVGREGHALPLPPDHEESAEILAYGANSVELDVRAKSPGWVVLSDVYMRGWTATVDGLAAAVVPANHAMRAVRVSSGHHKVVMRFVPPHFAVAKGMSVLGILVTLGLFVRHRWARRTSSTHEQRT